MYKEILVPIDLSHVADNPSSITTAKEIAAQSGAHLTLLNVIPAIPPYVAVEIPSGVHEKVVATARDDLKNLVKTHGLPEETNVRVENGNVAHEILRASETKGTDLVVIASHKPGLSDYLLGSVASRVVRHATCSVLVVR